MGPAICGALEAQGAEVVTHVGALADPQEPRRVVEAANCFVGQIFPVCGGWLAR